MTSVLIVDDEDDARGWVCLMFKDMGFETFDARDGYEALQILLENPSIELLFADVRLPVMRGTVLAMAGKTLSPNLKVILTTGYDPEDVEASDLPLLCKPFAPSKLVDTVREVVGLA